MSTKKEIEQKVDDFLDQVLYGCFTVQGERFEELLGEVLDKIWSEIKEKSDQIQSIIFADGSSLFPIEHEGKKWIIFFPDSLCEQSNETIRHVIAHEFAHFILGHDEARGKKIYQEGERVADKLAIKWGFPQTKETKRETKF